MDVQIPKYIDNNVQIVCEDELGRGTYGVVRKAKCMGNYYAVKNIEIDPQYGISSDVLREIDISRRFLHPNLVHNLRFTYNKQDNTVSLLLPVADDNLYNYRKNIINDMDRIKMLRDIVSALSFLHEFNVLYLDVKLENILVFSGKAVITDFGLTLYSDDTGSKRSDTGSIRMTPNYVPPELNPEPTKNKRSIYLNTTENTVEYTRACDVWALGVLMLELFNPKWKGFAAPGFIASRDANKFLDQNRNQTILQILGRNPGREIMALLNDMLNIDPSKRPSMQQVHDVLSALITEVDTKQIIYMETEAKDIVKSDVMDCYRMYQLYTFAVDMNFLAETVFLAGDLYHQCRSINTDTGLVLAGCVWIAEKLIEYQYHNISQMTQYFGRPADRILDMELTIMQHVGGILYRRFYYYYGNLPNGVDQMMYFSSYGLLDFKHINKVEKSEQEFATVWRQSILYRKLKDRNLLQLTEKNINELLAFLRSEYVSSK